jgi:hypothetical protein
MNYETLPSSLSSIYEEIDTEVKWIHVKWNVYKQLFDSGQEKIDLINRSAPQFFGIIRQIFFVDVVLSLSRLTDPAESFGHKNLSFELLIDEFQSSGYSALCSKLVPQYEMIKLSCKPFRKWRNKKISHRDFLTALNTRENPLPDISKTDIEHALEKVRSFMEHINLNLFETKTYYEHAFTTTGGNVLLGKLKEAEKYKNLYLDSVKSQID